MKTLDSILENVPHVVAACVVLQNTCEMYGDMCLAEWNDRTAPDPPILDNVSINRQDDEGNVGNAIMKFLSTTSIYLAGITGITNSYSLQLLLEQKVQYMYIFC